MKSIAFHWDLPQIRAIYMANDDSGQKLPSNVNAAQAEKLKKLQPGAYCSSRSWGFGQIRSWDSDGDALIIDFKGKSAHAMQFGYAADTLVPIPTEHVLAQIQIDLERLKQQAQTEPATLIRLCIESLGKGATADGIMAVLCPDVVAEPGYKKWWEGTKRTLKKDGLFFVPSKKTEALRVLEAAGALGESAVADLRVANGTKAILLALPAVIRHWQEVKNETLAREIVELLNANLAKIPKSQLPIQLELALSRDEFMVEAALEPETGALSVVSLSPQTAVSLSPVLDSLPGAKQPKLLESLRKGMPDEWPSLFQGLLPKANGRVAETITDAFVEADQSSVVVSAVDRLLRERNVTCDFLFWLCKNRPEIYSTLIEPNLFMAILSVLEKDQFSEIKKGTKLYELVLADKPLMAVILKGAPLADVRDITRAILLSPVFEELDKRSLLATIIKLYPEVQAMVVGDNKSAQEAKLIVSWPSLQKRKAELDDLINRQIPQNTQDIQIARGYGDLKENHEFKSAKEMQTVLNRRRDEYERMLTRAEATDFAGADTKQVSLGTKVTIKDATTGVILVYVILGAWDSDTTAGIISYETAVAQALLSRKIGDQVDLKTDDGSFKSVVIEKIEPHGIDLSVPN